jgi:hypothetical protein
LTSYGRPEEILTDNSGQYVTWRGKSAFSRELDKRGIKQVVAAPRRPQTLGKIERFWGTLWRECVESAAFIDLGDAQRRIGHYNFQRPHQGIDDVVPADRFFGVASEVKKTLQARVAANALELAGNGVLRKPFYLTGQMAGQPFSAHAEGERKILIGAGGTRQVVELVAPVATAMPSTGAATIWQPHKSRPTRLRGRAVPRVPPRPRPGSSAPQSRPANALPSRTRSAAWSVSYASSKGCLLKRNLATKTRRPCNVRCYVVRSWRMTIFGLRGGEFPYRFTDTKRQRLGEGHKCAQARNRLVALVSKTATSQVAACSFLWRRPSAS